ncbi:MAG: hypothetical protein H6831_11660 [Planctomycetes bacterium]|nr:hypothetical protein [Planctomycetota bacterium]MCB9905056.1 hypothetical protein [Planctomycetota bacterium]
MNKILQYVGIGFCALLLFGGAFLGFAKLSGAPMHTLPVLGGFFQAPDEYAALVDSDTRADRDSVKRSVEEEVQVGASVLGAFVLPSPYTSEQIKDLEMLLKSKLREAQLELDRMSLRRLELDEREAALQDRWGELQELRSTLERFEEDLNQRSAEIERDEAARSEKEVAALQDLAKVFEEGEPEELVNKLQAYGEEDAAKLLAQMDVERVAELLRAMDEENYVRFSKAYTAEQLRKE